ncbi:hypothetical protein TRFO_18054 [Tritrichomonas foetus]|uniref:Uncharacterized protein n=1 Tax=Tritrichomonas foetus TaxID=1144522 RepID=A0A1J4KLR0_9EUKA|nr:hypothetical protein TRFO_18054 [Tritrichomonas foetus]|eukprot:OHT12247.1 hypothetical protein TRFO_18054 [Tritrichomonas foetus]
MSETPSKSNASRPVTPAKSSGNTPAKSGTPAKCSGESCKSKCCIKCVIVLIVCLALSCVGGYFVHDKAGKKGLAIYGVSVALVTVTFFIVSKLLKKKQKTD